MHTLPHTREWESHMAVLRDLFQRVRQANLTLRPTKCFVGYPSILFTGHVVGAGKLQMEPDKVERVRNAERPTTKKEVRSFLGLAGFYRKFIPNFTRIAAPFTDLTRKGQPKHVTWTDLKQVDVDALKECITSVPI